MKEFTTNNILLFDGFCNLCNGFVQFVIRNEKNNKIKFGSLQSQNGIKILNEYDIDPIKIDSIIFVSEGKAYMKSEAVFKILNYLKLPWNYLGIFRHLPINLSNYVYDKIAKRRYVLFGRKKTCWVPTLELKKKFIS